MEWSKIHLSDAEEKLMMDAGVILTKNRVLQEIKHLLETVEKKQFEFTMTHGLRDHSPFEIAAKVSRGENYRGLPWLILDYPRQSAPEGHFFIRQLFWWGHFFSSTLHLSGREKEKYQERIIKAREQLNEYYIGVNEDPWQHHLSAENYLRIGELDSEAFRKLCEKGSHLKITRFLPLEKWSTAPEELFGQWKVMLQLCGLIT